MVDTFTSEQIREKNQPEQFNYAELIRPDTIYLE